jgi:hypothetical protein
VFSLISAVLLILCAPDAKVEAFKDRSAALMVVAQGALARVITIVITLEIRSGSAKTASGRRATGTRLRQIASGRVLAAIPTGAWLHNSERDASCRLEYIKERSGEGAEA